MGGPMVGRSGSEFVRLTATVRDERFTFADLREVFAKANELKSGDVLAGLAARSERERVAAKRVLADLTLAEVVAHPLIDPATDEVSRLILDTQDHAAFAPIRGLTVGELREYLLLDETGAAEIRAIQPGITPEVAAAVAKLMSNKDLALVREQGPGRDSVSQHDGRGRGVLGVRVQPNHPADDLGGILFSAVDGLLYGCGDAMLGVNPVNESVATTDGHPPGPRPPDRVQRDPDASLLPGAHHDSARRDGARCAGRPPLPVGRREPRGRCASFGVSLALLQRGA